LVLVAVIVQKDLQSKSCIFILKIGPPRASVGCSIAHSMQSQKQGVCGSTWQDMAVHSYWIVCKNYHYCTVVFPQTGGVRLSL